MLWLKALHIVFMVTWFAGLFYLPRLFVYHSMSNDSISNDRFKIMERKLFFGIMTPGMILTLVFGLWMLADGAWTVFGGHLWLQLKLILVALLVVYHLLCGSHLFAFRADRNTHSHVYFRWFNEVPVLFMTGIILLAVLRPV